MSYRCALALLALTLPLLAQGPDKVHLKGGSVLQGTVLSLSPEGLTLQLAPGVPPLKLDWAQLDGPGLVSGRSARVGTKEGELIEGRIAGVQGGTITLERPDGSRPQLAVGNLPALGKDPLPAGQLTAPLAGPPPKKTLLKPQEWTGRVRLAGAIREGNVDSFLVDLAAEAQRTWEEDRLRAWSRFRYGETEEETTAASALIGTKFDHFIREDFYVYANSEVTRDEVQDLDFRALLGAGAGYKPWKAADDRFFAVEGGITALYQDFRGRSGDLDPAGRVAMEYQNTLFEELTFGQTVEILFPLTDLQNFVFRSGTALAYPISESINLDARLDLTWFGEPPQGTVDLDTVFTVGIEYRF